MADVEHIPAEERFTPPEGVDVYGLCEWWRVKAIEAADEVERLRAELTLKERAACLICGEEIAKADQPAHLAARHRGPFKFHHNGVEYSTDRPSMTVVELKGLVVCTPTYIMWEERAGGDVAYADGQAVDLTREPWFFSIPPAYMGGRNHE